MEDEELYRSDSFRMESMKVLPCTKHYVHDWTECPFAHPHEKARRRDLRRYSYTGIACPSMRQDGSCSLEDNCPYAHNVFEYWLHPTRYRTQLCNDGTTCSRKICFFAHSIAELRTPESKPFVPAEAVIAAAAAAAAAGGPVEPLAAAARSPCQSADFTAQPAQPLQQQSPTLPPTQQHAPPVQRSSQTAQDHPLVEVMTRLVARGKVSAEKSAAILQQVLPPDALQELQAASLASGSSPSVQRVCSSDSLGWAKYTSSPIPDAAQAAGLGGTSTVRYSADNAAAFSAATELPSPGSSGQMEQGPSLAEMRLAMLQDVLQQAKARAAAGGPGSAAFRLLGPEGGAGDSARSSLDTVRASFDGLHMNGMGPSPHPSKDANPTFTNMVQQQQLLQALQQQAHQVQQAQALATAASSSFFSGAGGPAVDRHSLDSQLSVQSRHGMVPRHSMESRPSMESAPSMDGALLFPQQRLSHDFARMSLDEAAPRANVFSSGFYSPGAGSAPLGAAAPTMDATRASGGAIPPAEGLAAECSQLLHPRPRRSF